MTTSPSFKLPQITFIYNRSKTGSTIKKAPLEIRIYYNYKQKYISTGVMLYSNQWKKGNIVNCPDAVEISQHLNNLIKSIRQIILTMMDNGHIDIFSIPQKLKTLDSNRLTFIDFCSQRTAIRQYGKAKGTQKRYAIFIKLFKEWGKIRLFEDVTEANIIAFDRHLDAKHLKQCSKWGNYHKFLNTFIFDAVNEGYLHSNPYKILGIDKGKDNAGIMKHLTLEEFNRLKIAVLPSQSLEKVRDVFIFQSYTCLSYSDLRDFDVKKIQEVKGTKVYVGHRNKTGGAFTIPLLPTALKLLEKYDGKLPIISNVKYNAYLKIIAQASGIDKPLSSHWARHTGATLLLNGGVPMQIVSKICGHSSTRITEQVYAKLLDETVVDAITNMKDNI